MPHYPDSDLFFFYFVHIRNAIQWMRHTFFFFFSILILVVLSSLVHILSLRHLHENYHRINWIRDEGEKSIERWKKQQQQRNNYKIMNRQSQANTTMERYTRTWSNICIGMRKIFVYIWHFKNGSKRPKQKQNYKNNWWNNKINIKLKHKWK